MPPNLEPMVSIGRLNAYVTAVAATNATTVPGTCDSTLGNRPNWSRRYVLGHSTTTAKLAKHLIEKRKKKVLTVSADVYRPAAIEQLKTVTGQAGAEWFPSAPDQKPRDIALAALDYAKKHYFDVLLVDTAGRLAIDEALMAEIRELHATLNPVETLFVVDAMQGQDAVNTAKAFKEALPLTGVILTKLDGDARGGAALSIYGVLKKPIKYIGVGEKPDALEEFHPDRMAGRILQQGDVISLVEKAQASMDADAAKKLEKKVRKEGLDLQDFLAETLGAAYTVAKDGSMRAGSGPAWASAAAAC